MRVGESHAAPNKSLEKTANSTAFIRETCVIIALCAPPLGSSVRFHFHKVDI
jgi:hypothetical protein